MAPTDHAGTKGSRAKQACRKCNARRVRCDVTEVQPCSNCEKAGDSCELVQSRRGKYPRRPRGQLVTASSESPGSLGDVSVLSTVSEPAPAANALSARRSARNEHRSSALSSEHADSPSSLRTRGFERPFLGESNFFSLVASQPQPIDEPGPDAAGRPAADLLATSSPMSNALQTDMDHLSANTARFLRDEGAFSHPDMVRSMPVLKAYFDWFHPCFPVLDRSQIASQVVAGNISHLLLLSILFVGFTYCEEDALVSMGFQGRSEAKSLMYQRAKLLFQADVEKDRLTIIQAVFLLSFWRSSASEISDVRYWIGVAITLAESQGLHRSTRFTTKDPHIARLRRRIWWSIYVRERQAAASLGLPCRIRDSDCDVETLSAADLESVSTRPDPSPFGTCQPEHVTYSIKMVEIAKMLSQVVDMYFAPGGPIPSPDDARVLNDALEASIRTLPDGFREFVDRGNNSVWACLLHLAYNHVRLLIYQGTLRRNNQPAYGSQAAHQAASQISRIAEDMLMQGTIRYGQMHLITSLFAALCVHAINTHKATGVAQTISKHRAQMCVLGLKEVNKYWMVNVDMLDFFLRYLEDPSVQPPRAAQPGIAQQPGAAEAPGSQPAIAGSSSAGGASDQDGNELFPDQYFDMIYGPWGGEAGLGIGAPM